MSEDGKEGSLLWRITSKFRATSPVASPSSDEDTQKQSPSEINLEDRLNTIHARLKEIENYAGDPDYGSSDRKRIVELQRELEQIEKQLAATIDVEPIKPTIQPKIFLSRRPSSTPLRDRIVAGHPPQLVPVKSNR